MVIYLQIIKRLIRKLQTEEERKMKREQKRRKEQRVRPGKKRR